MAGRGSGRRSVEDPESSFAKQEGMYCHMRSHFGHIPPIDITTLARELVLSYHILPLKFLYLHPLQAKER